MRFSNIFGKKKEKQPSSIEEKTVSMPDDTLVDEKEEVSPSSQPEQETVDKPEVQDEPEAPVSEETPPEEGDLDESIKLFESIQDAISNDDDTKVPLKALLCNLPERLRGSNWNSSAFPEGDITLETNSLIEKLQSGQVVYPMAMINAKLPDGWINATPQDEVELDLSIVCESIPPEKLAISSKISKSMEKIIDMPDYFTTADKTKGEEPPAEDKSSAVDEQPITEETSEPAPETPIEKELEEEVSTELKEEPEEEVPTEPEEKPEEIEPEEEVPSELEEKPEEIEPEEEVPTEPEEKPEEIEPEEEVPSELEEEPEEEVSGIDTSATSSVLKPATYVSTTGDKWDGSEKISSAAVAAINLNDASLAELLTLPGVGKTRADAILHYRNIHGNIESIYDLLCIPGIGRNHFETMTGLDPDKRENRHITLNRVLGLSDSARPSLSRVANESVKALNVAACVLVATDGTVIARSNSILMNSAEQLAALAPKIFRGTKKYLPRLSGKHPNMFALPGSTPPVLFVGTKHLFLVLALSQDETFKSVIDKSAALSTELDWIFSPRAIIRGN